MYEQGFYSCKSNLCYLYLSSSLMECGPRNPEFTEVGQHQPKKYVGIRRKGGCRRIRLKGSNKPNRYCEYGFLASARFYTPTASTAYTVALDIGSLATFTRNWTSYYSIICY